MGTETELKVVPIDLAELLSKAEAIGDDGLYVDYYNEEGKLEIHSPIGWINNLPSVIYWELEEVYFRHLTDLELVKSQGVAIQKLKLVEMQVTAAYENSTTEVLLKITFSQFEEIAKDKTLKEILALLVKLPDEAVLDINL